MNAELHVYKSREEWLQARTSYIGGSDAACILGLNPWKSNQRLWEEKTGRTQPDDLSENEAVNYGADAEEYLRELFKLDYPEMEVEYIPHNMWTNASIPWAHASLDGWMTDPDGRRGILEIKTSTINSSLAGEKWKDKIPDTYFSQIIHYFLVTGFKFAIVKAQLKYEREGEEPFLITRHYRIERADCEADIQYLAAKEREFAEYIKKDIRPALILPEI